MNRRKTRLVCLAIVGIVCIRSVSVGAEVLITEQEASLPAAVPTQMTTRGITRAPRILKLSPAADAAVVKSPFKLSLKFESFGGATIDPTTIKVFYLKNPTVDLTERLKSHFKDNGINLETAEAPPGDHPIRMEIKDSEGRTGVSNFMLKVTK